MSDPKLYVSEMAGCVAFPAIATAAMSAGGAAALPVLCGWAIVGLG